MPKTTLKHLAKQANVSFDRAEHLWNTAKDVVTKEYGEDHEGFYALVTGITKKMLGLSEEAQGSPSDWSEGEIDFKKLDDLPKDKPHSNADVMRAMQILFKMATKQSHKYGGPNSKLLPSGISEMKKITFKNYLVLEQNLHEDKKDYIKTAFEKKLKPRMENDSSAPSDMDQLVDAIVKISAPHAVWLMRMYVTEQFRFEDLARLKDEIEKFKKFKSKLVKKDLNSYDTLTELYDALEPFENADAPVSKKAEVRMVKDAGSDVVIDKPNIKVVHLKTKEAACHYGANTKWCTAGSQNNAFDEYASSGNIYVVMVKLKDKQRKFQFHVESEQFMDERDTPLTKSVINELSAIDGYSDFINHLIKKHYSNHIK